MFNVGGGEFLVIAAIALIVLGPQRLPEAARQIGKVMGEVRRLSSGFQQELRGALNDADRTAGAEPPATTAGAKADPAPSAGSGSGQRGAAAPRRKAPLRAAPASKRARPPSKGA